MPTPVLETERLLLRAPRLSDFAASERLWTDPDVARFTGGEPRAPSFIWDQLLKKAGQWSLLGHGYFMVEERATASVIGEAGLALNIRVFDPAPSPDRFVGAPEIGWAFLPSAQGRGFAREAAQAVVAWGDANVDAPRTVCLINVAHERSLKLAAGLGYSPFHETHLGASPVVLLERDRP